MIQYIEYYCVNMKPYKYKHHEAAALIALMSISICIGYRLLDYSSPYEIAISVVEILGGFFFAYNFYRYHLNMNEDLFNEIKNNFNVQGEFK